MTVRRPRARDANRLTTPAVSLRIICKDGRGEPIASSARVRVLQDATEGASWIARGKSGAVSEFQFAVPPGRYIVDVDADGYKRSQDVATVKGGAPTCWDIRLSLADNDENDRDDVGEKDVVDGRFTHFVALRSPGSLKKRGATPFPNAARTTALEHARRMVGASAEGAGLKVKRIDDPVPRSSFGSVDAFVDVKPVRRGKTFAPTALTIPFNRDHARHIDVATLRMFRIDPGERTFTLVDGCIPDLHLNAVQGIVSTPGIYGLYGLPTSPAIRRTIDLMCTFRDQVVAERRAGIDRLQRRICELILCTREFNQIGDLGGFVGIGGIGGNICDQCVEMDFGPGGPPECQIGPGPVITPGCNWTCLGPRNINGRVRALAIHPADGNILVAGTGTGGVWLTRDAGQSWKALMHDEASLAIGAVAVHLTDPGNPAGNFTIYAGTGEPTWWPGYAGVGVLKSTDSGATWTATGVLPSPGNTGFASILIDATTVTSNPATTTLYAAGTPGGLYQSTNGGATWTLMRSGSILSVVFDPAVAGGLYITEAFGGILRFDPNTDTWSAFNTGLGAFPQLILVAIGRTVPNTMYAKLDQTVYRYDTGTSTWVSLGTHGGTTYGYWNNVLEVDPVDSNIVIAGGISIERTYDGGTTWQLIGGLHSDQHAAAFDSTNHLNIYAGNDGGVYRGTYALASALGAWTKTSDGLVVTEFNDVGTSLGVSDVVGGGAQDNGTSRTTGGLTWDAIAGADGGYFLEDPVDPHVQYAESQRGGLLKSTNGGASFANAMTGFPGGPWITPILLDPTSPNEPNRVLFAGGSSQVYRTTNSAGIWSASSPAMGSEVLALALAPSSSAVLYAGTGAGRIWRSSDNGATLANWAEITAGTVAGSANLPARAITDIVVHPTDPNSLYITFSGFNAQTPTTLGHVYRGVSTDAGVTWLWRDVTSNLPDIPANAIELLTSLPTTLYLGTDAGVFRTTNGGTSWGPFGDGLPSVIVSDLALDDSGTLLRAATYGRGMWQTRLTSTCLAQDVYVRDSKLDTGEVIPSPSGVSDPTIVGANVWWWESPDVKVDAYPYYAVDALFDGVEFDTATAEDPIRNDVGHPSANRLYVQVHNRGPLAANNVKVKVLYADASAGLPLLPTDFWASFPNDWSSASPWSTVDAVLPFQTIPTLAPNTPVVLRWDWNVPATAATHTCMLAIVSSDEDPVVRSDAVLTDRQLWNLVPNDKHVGLRNLHVITGSAPLGGSPFPQFSWLNFHNPFPYPQFFDLVVDRRALGREVDVALLLPEVAARSDVRKLRAPGIRVQPAKQRGWWTPALKDAGRHAFALAVLVDHPDDDPCGRAPTIAGVLLHPDRPLKVGIVIRQSRHAKPGDKAVFSLLQRAGGVLVGGSTFELRVPPTVVAGERTAKRSSRRYARE
jgi:hypothetical protein